MDLQKNQKKTKTKKTFFLQQNVIPKINTNQQKLNSRLPIFHSTRPVYHGFPDCNGHHERLQELLAHGPRAL
jgi:hypothetical protein